MTDTENVIPDDVRRFILTSIDSVPHLEALLLLRDNPRVEWDAEGISKRLYIAEDQASELLTRLREAGFLTVREANVPLYCYSPASGAQEQMVNRLAEVYANKLVDVTNLIHSKAATRVQQFADAFRLRKE